MKRIHLIPLVACLLSASVFASSKMQKEIYIPNNEIADTAGFAYFSIAAGLGLTEPLTYDSGPSTQADVHTKLGRTYRIAGGYDYDNGFRLELSWADFHNSGDNFEVSGTSPTPVAQSNEGFTRGHVLMLDGYYTFVRADSAWVPYVGLGVGNAWIEQAYIFTSGSIYHDWSGKDQALAYEAIVGASYRLSDSCQLFADYRYLGVNNQSFALDQDGVPIDIVSGRYKQHQLMMGLTYQLVG